MVNLEKEIHFLKTQIETKNEYKISSKMILRDENNNAPQDGRIRAFINYKLF